MIQRLGREYFQQIYGLMEKSFPVDEYRTREEQRELFSRKEYRVYGVPDQRRCQSSERLKAFIALWEFADFTFIEHFAVNPSYRNRGMGAVILREILQESFPLRPGPICLEVEPPGDELSDRRIGFYQRNGFVLNDYPYRQPPISAGRKSIPLKMMTWKNGITQEEFLTIRDRLYETVYGVRQE